MKTLFERISSIIRHNGAVSVGIVICVVVLVWSVGCESMTKSIISPDTKKVTWTELDLEIQAEQDRLAREVAELQARATVAAED